MWVCPRTKMGLPVYPCGFARSPIWVCQCSKMGTPSHPYGCDLVPRWVCPCTHVGLAAHPDGFGLVPRRVCPRTQMGHRKDPPDFRAALGAGGPEPSRGAGFHEGGRGHSCPLHAWVFAAAPPFQKMAGRSARAPLGIHPRPAAQRPWSAPVLWSSGKPGWPGPGPLNDDRALPAEGAERRRGAALRGRCARSGVRLGQTADLKAAGAGLTRPVRGRLRRTRSGHRCQRRAGGRNPRPWAAAAGSRAARAG